MRAIVTGIVSGLMLALSLVLSSPASAAITGSGNGYIDSPDQGATFTRVPPQPYVLVDFKASGMEVALEGATANQQLVVSWEFVLLLGTTNPPTNILSQDAAGPVLIQADANGDWHRWAKEGTPDEGKLERLGYGVGPGGWNVTIKSILQLGGTAIANYSHPHSFTVN